MINKTILSFNSNSNTANLKIFSVDFDANCITIASDRISLGGKAMIRGNEVRVGNLLEYKDKIWLVLDTMHTQPGKGGAYMQVKMKSIPDGTNMDVRFASDDTVVRARLEERQCQFLYMDGDNAVFMDSETYEQFELQDAILGKDKAFLQDGLLVSIGYHNSQPLTFKLPETMELVVSECEPVVKGQTAASSYKPGVLENGVRIMVPPFISPGDKIILRTEDKTYLKRAANAD